MSGVIADVTFHDSYHLYFEHEGSYAAKAHSPRAQERCLLQCCVLLFSLAKVCPA